MRTLHQILLLGAALLWATGHARAALPQAPAATVGSVTVAGCAAADR